MITITNNEEAIEHLMKMKNSAQSIRRAKSYYQTAQHIHDDNELKLLSKFNLLLTYFLFDHNNLHQNESNDLQKIITYLEPHYLAALIEWPVEINIESIVCNYKLYEQGIKYRSESNESS